MTNISGEALKEFVLELGTTRTLSGSGAILLADELERAMHINGHSAALTAARFERPPVVIAGLPRTGTTLLHHLLALSPEAWSPTLSTLMWPSLAPSLAADRTSSQLALLRFAAPTYTGLHPLSADEPAECINAMMANGRCPLWDLFWNVPAQLDAFCRSAKSELSTYFRIIANSAVSDGARDRVPYLKSPYHSLWVDDLLSVDPRLRIVYVRRDFETVCTSWIGLVVAVQSGFLTTVEPDKLASRWVRTWDTALEQLASIPKDRCLVLDFDDVATSPAAAAQTIAAWSGESADSRRFAERIQTAWLASRPRQAFGQTQSSPYRTLVIDELGSL